MKLSEIAIIMMTTAGFNVLGVFSSGNTPSPAMTYAFILIVVFTVFSVHIDNK